MELMQDFEGVLERCLLDGKLVVLVPIVIVEPEPSVDRLLLVPHRTDLQQRKGLSDTLTIILTRQGYRCKLVRPTLEVIMRSLPKFPSTCDVFDGDLTDTQSFTGIFTTRR